MIGSLSQELAELIPLSFVDLLPVAVGGHLVGLVDHAQVPAHVAEQIEDVVLAGHEVDRRDALRIVVPDVSPVSGSHGSAVDHGEGFAEFVLKLAPPLVGQGWRG